MMGKRKVWKSMSRGNTMCVVCNRKIKAGLLMVTYDNIDVDFKSYQHNYRFCRLRHYQSTVWNGVKFCFVMGILWGGLYFVFMGNTSIATLGAIILTVLLKDIIDEKCSCDYCGQEFRHKENKEQHEIICEYSSEPKYYRG